VRLHKQAWLLVFCALLCACGGGGGGGGGAAPASVIVAATATPTPPPSSSASVQAGAAPASGTLATISGGYGGAVAFPATSSGSATANLLLAAMNTVTLQSSSRLPKAIGGNLDPLAYITLQTTATVTFRSWPSFAFFLPAGFALPAGAALYLGYDPGDVAGNWSTLAGPASVNGSVVTLAPGTGPITFVAGTTYAFALFATAQVLVAATPTPSPSPSPSPTATATSQSNTAFTCPATGAASASFTRLTGAGEATRRAALRRSGTAVASSTTLLAVTYDRSRAQANAVQIASREQQLGVNLVHAYDFARQNIALRVISVPTASVAQTEATLRTQDGVRSVAVTGERRYRTTTSAFYTADPYFQGFQSFFERAPYAESSSVPGQWDMHAIGLEHAYGYSVPGAGYTSTAAALGSASIKIAIIDTGEDASHPELGSKIVYQHCFVTNEAGTAQSVGNFSTDEDGHGTDVSGIAAAASGNALGFTGAGGKAVIYAYRVFPTPDDACAADGDDPQCSAATQDIASAITDAIAQNVNVISMSLGGGGCDTHGNDTDPVEGAAIAEAIKANVIVVAASGNGAPSTSGVTAPGCDTSVIAAGATSLADGTPTGTSTSTGYTSAVAATATSANPVEYVASYSQFGSPTENLRNAAAWGIVAPGGDPAGNGDGDDLHWIENIWTTTPFDGNFDGECAPDFGSSSISDCRTLIAGTSMATPHVAGAVALILAVSGSTYATPVAMKQLLCSTADDLGDTHEGCGRMNVYRAMAVAIGDTNPP
jgi:subtilisin family serine protease